ncbi:transferase [Richelia sinica]|nr:transferase [Richelia sinica]MBD2666599.1 transferase [Richelia sinica FACHB-800]
MSVPLLRLSDNFSSYISGEVNIHPSAVLAPGVILQAAANSRIIIGAGVCIGMGSILQVNEGTLEIEAGANLGAGFLMVGQGKIGASACIGAATTVFNCSVAPGQVVPPGSILGDVSRQMGEAEPQSPSPSTSTSTNTPEATTEETVVSSTQISAAFVELKHQSTTNSISVPSPPTPKSQSPPPEETPLADASPSPESPEPEPSAADTQSPNSFGTQIYGQGSIQRLLTTLFPHRQALNDQGSDNSSE